MKTLKTKVAVVGAGPVGSVLSYCLAKEGIDAVLLEAGDGCAQDLRASTFHPPTLEILDKLGMAEKLIERGLKAPIYQFRERRTGEVIEFDLTEISDITRFPYRLQCEQYHLSRMLCEAVEEGEAGRVLFGHRVLGFEQNGDEAIVYAETPREVVAIHAEYVVGADGANSIVRKWLGTEFHGFTYPTKFLCYTTNEPLDQAIVGLRHVNYVSDPEEWMVLLRVPSLWRVLVPASQDTSDEVLRGDAKKEEVFERLIGKADVETAHRTVYHVHQRVAKSFRQGRAILVGDAAHLNNPIGGFGMNSGIHDAANLLEKFVGIFKHGLQPDDALTQYERQRREITHAFTQAQTIRNLEYLAQGEGKQHELRKAEMQAVAADPERRRQFLLRQSMIETLPESPEIA